MTEDERKAYERRRADELYENMLRSQEVAKNRAADVVLEIMASLIMVIMLKLPLLGTLEKNGRKSQS